VTASRRCSALWLLPLLWLLPVPGRAQISMTLGATGEYQYNSNLLDLQSGLTDPGVPASAPRGDSVYDATAAYGLKYRWSQQTAFVDLSGSEYRYNYYSQLNHSEYSVDAGWTGKFMDDFDGNFEVLRDRRIVPFLYEIGVGSALLVSTEQREQGGLGWQFTPRWRIEGSAYGRDVTWPQPGDLGLKVDESEGQVALKYLGTAALTSGASFTYISGHYGDSLGDAPDSLVNPPYRQEAESLLANYMGAHSTFMGQLGYTRRTSPGQFSLVNSASGVTGSLAYSNQLTGKTSFNATVARLITAYVTNTGSEIDDVAALNVLWQATYKTGVTLGYAYTYSSYPGQGNNPPGSTRLDHYQTAQLQVTYQAQRWLVIKPFCSRQLRRSNLFGASFDGTAVGVDLTVQWQHP
jgi:hypothetical protein